MTPRPPTSPPFPSTPLFRSESLLCRIEPRPRVGDGRAGDRTGGLEEGRGSCDPLTGVSSCPAPLGVVFRQPLLETSRPCDATPLDRARLGIPHATNGVRNLT